jgi:hypothetical protein
VNGLLKNTRDGLAGFFIPIMPHTKDIQGKKDQSQGIVLKSGNTADW